MDGLNTFISLYGLPVVFIILLIKSSGLPIPVPADVIMVAATQAAFGQLPLAAAFGTIVLALLVGACCNLHWHSDWDKSPPNAMGASCASRPSGLLCRRRRCAQPDKQAMWAEWDWRS